ncbi:MAG: sulfite exporter TauE/SafE family protein [Sphingobacteriia bacterium]|nr:sulfite exporter TauE/SafE family protein [Sphingobacteriia bacterium]NCC38729.1 sulfite exporter TauE/SafE family protein [Gammaproteobacteria bacterium]
MVRSAFSAVESFYDVYRRRLHFWVALVGLTLILILVHGALQDAGWIMVPESSLATSVILAVFATALACEYLDSSLGMGYGTTLTPLLLLAGFEPLQIVPAVLFSELLTGVAAGVMHHRDGNIDLMRDPAARRTFGLLAGLSAVGAIAAVLVAIKISATWFGILITGIVLTMGVVTVATARRRIRYRPSGILAIGLVAAFNKGVSGGGYGPLVTSGQVVSGVPAKHAVAITSVAESFTCAVGLLAYVVLKGGIDWSLTLPLAAGALLSVPIATATVKRLPESWLRLSVGVLTLALGLVLLVKLIG